MSLDFRVAPVVFDKGLDTRSQRKLVVAGKWDSLVNLALSQDGSLKRRDGYDLLVPNIAGTTLAVRNEELVMANGGELYAVGTDTRRAQIPGEMPMVDIRKSEVLFNETSVDQQDMAAESTLGYACYVWRSRPTGGTPTGLRVTLVETTSGAKLLNNQALITSATATSPRVVCDGGVFFVFYIDGPDLFCRVVRPNVASPLGSQVSLVNNADLSSKNFDATSIHNSTLGQRVVVAYMLAAPNATSVQAFICDQTAGVPALIGGVAPILTAAQVTEASVCGIAVRTFDALTAGQPRVGFFVLHTAGGALAAGLIGVTTLQGLAIAAGPANISATVPPVNGPCHVTATPVNPGAGEVMQVFFDQQSSYNTADTRPLQAVSVSAALAVMVNQLLLNSACFGVNPVGPVVTDVAGPQGPFIAGKAFTFGVRTFLPVMMLENYFRPTATLVTATGASDTTSAQCSLWLLDTTNIVTSVSGTWHLVGGALYGTLGLLDTTLGGSAPTVSTPCSTPLMSGTASGAPTVYGLAVLERGRLQLTTGANTTPVGLSSLALAPQVGPSTRGQLGESLYFAGGQLGAYDGQQVIQNGFPMYPEGIFVLASPRGSPVVTPGVHQVVAVYEWTDGAGNRHQSAPSLPVSVTVAANDQINVSVPTTQLPQNAGYDATVSTLSIVCYMTEVDGVDFYRAPQSYAPTLNSTIVTRVVYVIGNIVMTDDRLTQNELLYTQPSQPGTALPNITSGPLHGLGIAQNRVWGFLSDEPGEYTFSQRVQQNTGLQFNPDALGGRLPVTAGEGVAIAELDEKTILFAERAIYAVFGNGPDASGANNGFSEPQPIATDVGCTEPLSVLLMPMGLVFKSQKGWQLLGRDLSVRYIGDGVARFDEFTVSSAVLMGDRQECRFTSVQDEGPTLVYSYLSDAWSVFWTGSVGQSGFVTDAVWWPALGRFMQLLSADAQFPGIAYDTPGQYVDGVGSGGTAVVAPIYGRTAFLHVSSIEGFQRVRRLYLTMTADVAPTSDFSIAFDFNDVHSGSLSYTVAGDFALMAGLQAQSVDIRHRLAIQKCKSVAFSFSNAGTAELSFPIIGIQALALEVGIKRGVNKLPAAQSVG